MQFLFVYFNLKSYLNKVKTGIPYGLGNLALGIYSRETLCACALGKLEQEMAPTPISLMENPTDRGAWWATVHGVAKSWTGLSD